MNGCIYVYMYPCISLYMHICINVCSYTCIFVYKSVYIFTSVYEQNLGVFDSVYLVNRTNGCEVVW